VSVARQRRFARTAHEVVNGKRVLMDITTAIGIV
jgi:hypothetical protein